MSIFSLFLPLTFILTGRLHDKIILSASLLPITFIYIHNNFGVSYMDNFPYILDSNIWMDKTVCNVINTYLLFINPILMIIIIHINMSILFFGCLVIDHHDVLHAIKI